MATLTVGDILNTIRDNASPSYMKSVGAYDGTNLSKIGGILMGNADLRNEFCKALWEKVAVTTIKAKIFKNPLAPLKNNIGRPYGSMIEDIYVNPAKDVGEITDATKILKSYNPDAKACYYKLGRKSTYPHTIPYMRLKTAFISEQSFMSFYDGVITALYSGDEIDEFRCMKKILATAIDGDGTTSGVINVITSDISTPAGAKELLKNIGQMSLDFTFPQKAFSPYNSSLEKGSDGDYKKDENGNYVETPCETWTPLANQVLLINSKAKTEINYEVLATTFNLSKAEIEAMTIVVDTIPSTKYDIYAVLMDRETYLCPDHSIEIETDYQKGVRQMQVYLHHWGWINLSLFPNCIAFGKEL